MSFNLADYEPVADRLARFWTDHPSGRVITHLMSREDKVVTFKATVWFDRTEIEATATGWASEIESERGVNATSALENCETSAIGRALANCNYATKGQRPSREEMAKADTFDPETDHLINAFLDEIAKAKNDAAIMTVGKNVAAARTKGEIPKAAYDRLARAAAERKAELNGAAA